MRRILFYTENFAGKKAKGGTEVATRRIAHALKLTNDWEVFCAFRRKADPEDSSIYKKTVSLPASGKSFEKTLAQFLKDNEIDVVVNMSRFFRHSSIVEASRLADKEIKVLFMQHFAPGSEMKKPSFSSGLHLLKLNPYNPLYWLRASFYPLIKFPRLRRLPRLYKKVYDLSHKVVLLSDGYVKDYQNVGGFKASEKFVAVPNIFDREEIDRSNFLPVEKRPKRVLILSRMDEVQKRLSLALEIWKKIEADPDLADWQLDIVGSGHNEDIVRRLVKRHKLERVTLHGWKNPNEFLKNSRILMMTSEYEGLPLTILEAQAYGVVPIAFNSFGALKDIIENFENGVIIDNFGDVDTYVKKLTELMFDEDYLSELSRNGIEKSDKFAPKKIAERWQKILS